jgi:N-acetyl-anhydromuramyl-L-alanine amidase AmpD
MPDPAEDLPAATPPARIPFLQATWFTRPAAPRPIDLVVIHSAEVGEEMDGAEALMRRCAAPDARRASWHYAVDADSVTQSVLETDRAWHAPGANSRAIGIEICGRARQTTEEWADDFSVKALELAAWLAAGICGRWGIPVAQVDEDGLKACRRGITTHAAVSRAFKMSDHWDPGPFFPMEHFMNRVTWWSTIGRSVAQGGRR